MRGRKRCWDWTPRRSTSAGTRGHSTTFPNWPDSPTTLYHSLIADRGGAVPAHGTLVSQHEPVPVGEGFEGRRLHHLLPGQHHTLVEKNHSDPDPRQKCRYRLRFITIHF